MTQRLTAIVTPNPSGGEFSLTIMAEQSEKLKATLLDVRGTALVEKDFNTTAGTTVVSFDEELPAGMYILRLSADDATTALKVLVN